MKSPLLFALELGQKDIAIVIADRYFSSLEVFKQLQGLKFSDLSLFEAVVNNCNSNEGAVRILEIFHKKIKSNKTIVDNMGWHMISRVIDACLTSSSLRTSHSPLLANLLFDVFIDDIDKLYSISTHENASCAMPVLSAAIYKCCDKSVILKCLNFKPDINMRDTEGNTPLHYAARMAAESPKLSTYLLTLLETHSWHDTNINSNIPLNLKGMCFVTSLYDNSIQNVTCQGNTRTDRHTSHFIKNRYHVLSSVFYFFLSQKLTNQLTQVLDNFRSNKLGHELYKLMFLDKDIILRRPTIFEIRHFDYDNYRHAFEKFTSLLNNMPLFTSFCMSNDKKLLNQLLSVLVSDHKNIVYLEVREKRAQDDIVHSCLNHIEKNNDVSSWADVVRSLIDLLSANGLMHMVNNRKTRHSDVRKIMAGYAKLIMDSYISVGQTKLLDKQINRVYALLCFFISIDVTKLSSDQLASWTLDISRYFNFFRVLHQGERSLELVSFCNQHRLKEAFLQLTKSFPKSIILTIQRQSCDIDVAYQENLDSLMSAQQNSAAMRESSEETLARDELAIIKKIENYYSRQIREMGGVDSVISRLRTHLLKMSKSDPDYKVTDYTLDELKGYFKNLDCNNTVNELKKSYFQNIWHTAYRYLSDNNFLMDSEGYGVNDDTTGCRKSHYGEFKNCIAAFYRASIDSDLLPEADDNTDNRFFIFVQQLALIARAHNWDTTDANGKHYDDLELDQPSCIRGTPRRLWNSLIDHPLKRLITKAAIQNEIVSASRAYWKKNLTSMAVEERRKIYYTYQRATYDTDTSAINNLHVYDFDNDDIWKLSIIIFSLFENSFSTGPVDLLKLIYHKTKEKFFNNQPTVLSLATKTS